MDILALALELGGAVAPDGLITFPTDGDTDAFVELLEEIGIYTVDIRPEFCEVLVA